MTTSLDILFEGAEMQDWAMADKTTKRTVQDWRTGRRTHACIDVRIIIIIIFVY